MGFALWALLTALAFAGGWAVVLRWGARLPTAEQLVAACITATAIVIACILGLGFGGVLYAWTLALAVSLLSLGCLARLRPPPATLSSAQARLGSAARNALRSPPAALLTVASLGLVLYLAAYAYLLPSWGWDAMNYHNTATAYAYQDHSLHWFDTPYNLCNSYPKNLELLALWNGIFAPDDRLIDGAQLPLVLMGVVALAAMCRRAGASTPLAWSMGLCWLWMPAVFLNTPTDYVDAGAASLGLAAVLFLARLDAGPSERLFGALSLGLFAGSKVSGALQAVLLVPLVLLALRREKRAGAPISTLALQVAGMTAAVLALGGYSYLRDLVRFANPVWPVRAHIPLLDKNLPGEWDMWQLNTPPFRGPDDFKAMFTSFLDPKPFYIVDVRTGGFGPLWVYVLLPCAAAVTIWAAVRLARRVETPAVPAMLLLVVGAALTPARWWPRYTLGFPAGGLLAVAILASLLNRRALHAWLAGTVGLAALLQAWPARTGFFAPPSKLWEAWNLTPVERSHLKFDNWQQAEIHLRDEVIQPGEASIYDDSVSFVYQLWRYDWKNRVLYKPLKGDPGAWLADLDREHARWAAVRRGSLAERTLRSAGWASLWPCGSEDCGVWVHPGTDLSGYRPR